jgi:hypothetical protein
MQNEKTVKTDGLLSYYAGCLRVARADLARIENNAGNYPADMYGEAMDAARDELAAAESDFGYEFQACQALQELAAMDAGPVAVKAPVKKSACDFRIIRRFYAICQDFGLNAKEDERMRGAMSAFFRRRIESRTELSANDWNVAGDAVKSQLLTW